VAAVAPGDRGSIAPTMGDADEHRPFSTGPNYEAGFAEVSPATFPGRRGLLEVRWRSGDRTEDEPVAAAGIVAANVRKPGAVDALAARHRPAAVRGMRTRDRAGHGHRGKDTDQRNKTHVVSTACERRWFRPNGPCPKHQGLTLVVTKT